MKLSVKYLVYLIVCQELVKVSILLDFSKRLLLILNKNAVYQDQNKILEVCIFNPGERGGDMLDLS